jgi:hypothetical protein
MLAVTLLLKNDPDRALKIFETAVNELKLDTEQGQKILTQGNADLKCLLFNYIKCMYLKNGIGQGENYFKTDPVTRQLFTYLVKLDQNMAKGIFDERKEAEEMFDQAMAKM